MDDFLGWFGWEDDPESGLIDEWGTGTAWDLSPGLGNRWIARNTDSDEAVTVDGDIRTLVSVTRQGDFVRSGPEVADEGTFCKVI